MAKRITEAGRVGARELVLGGSYLAVTVLVFGLGIWVGRDLTERYPNEPGQVARADAPVRPPTEAIPRPVANEFFYEHQKKAQEQLAMGNDVPMSTPTEAPTTRLATPPGATATATRRVEATATRTVAPTLRPTASPTRRVVAASPIPTAARRGTERAFVVTVGETTNRDTATRWAQTLRGMNYAPTTDQRVQGRATIYRVRVGPFASMTEAQAAWRVLVGVPGFEGAVVSLP